MISFDVHGVTVLKAAAWDAEFDGRGALRIELGEDRRIILFMPYSTALEYATALNACNDREASSQAVAQSGTYLFGEG